MRPLFQIALAGLVTSLSFAQPTPVAAQGELSQCGSNPKPRDYPCQMVGRVAKNATDFRIFSLIRDGRAKTPAEARKILNIGGTAPAALPACGPKGNSTPLPCTFAGITVTDKDQWRAARLVAIGKARDLEEARAILAARDGARADALPACGDTANATPLPCDMGGARVDTRDDWNLERLILAGKARDRAEAKALVAERRAAQTQSELPACGDKANTTPLPCALGGYVVKSKEDWRVVRLIAIGKAKDPAEARAILAARDAARVETPQNLPACEGNAGKAALPCEVGQRVARSAEEIRIFRLIEEGRARNVAQAQDLLAARRAEARAAREAQQAAERARRQAERRERRRAERAAAAAAANAGDGPGANTQTEVVTGADIRASDEEYGTRVVTQDDGLSKFEKALLLGLGAVVVGKVLKNGDKVISNSGDRVVVESPEGDLRVLKDDNALIQRPGDTVQTRTYDDGSTRTMVTKPDGSRVITVRTADGTVLRRTNIDAGGTPTVIIDDTREEQAVVVSELPSVIDGARQASLLQTERDLQQALSSQLRSTDARRFSLRQVREIPQVRALAPQLELDAIQFATGSAAILPEQARALTQIGLSMRDLIARDPRTVILVEGHTDATGSATYNLALSDRRAETVALALTEYFDVPAANMVTQGYGEDSLKVPTLLSEAANRRAVVRNITGLLQ